MSRKIPNFLTIEEQEQLLNQFNLRYITPHRNRTMIQLLLNSGLRLSEMMNLKWSHINLTSGQIKVVEGKGSVDRLIYVSDKILKELQVWKERQFAEWGVSEYIFTTRTLNKLDGKSVRRMIKTYSLKAGITKHITTHSFRHTFATDLLRETDNLRIVQRALGHESIKSTQIYTHIVDKELEKAMKDFRKREEC